MQQIKQGDFTACFPVESGSPGVAFNHSLCLLPGIHAYRFKLNTTCCSGAGPGQIMNNFAVGKVENIYPFVYAEFPGLTKTAQKRADRFLLGGRIFKGEVDFNAVTGIAAVRLHGVSC